MYRFLLAILYIRAKVGIEMHALTFSMACFMSRAAIEATKTKTVALVKIFGSPAEQGCILVPLLKCVNVLSCRHHA